MVSSIIAKHFGYDLEQLPGKYMSVSDIDAKCKELTDKYAGKSIRQLSRTLGLEVKEEKDLEQKGIAEKIVVSMFGGKAKKLNQIALFEKFGLIGKTITFTSNGGRTEDMKLYHVWTFIFSGDTYGIMNGFLMHKKVIFKFSCLRRQNRRRT